MLDACRPQASIVPNSTKKGVSITAGGNLSSTVLGFTENWNTKLHGPIATKKFNKKIGKICFL
jgi:hypothetical protein